jgi:hypothetical protein
MLAIKENRLTASGIDGAEKDILGVCGEQVETH